MYTQGINIYIYIYIEIYIHMNTHVKVYIRYLNVWNLSGIELAMYNSTSNGYWDTVVGS